MHNLPRQLVAVLVLALLVRVSSLQAQPVSTDRQVVGVGGSAGLNMHSLDLNVYRASELCGTFDGGSGWRPNFHVLNRRNLSSDRQWWMTPQLHFNNLGAMFTTQALDQARARDPFDSSLVVTNREHQLDASLTQLGLDLFVGFQPVEHLMIFGGPSVGMLLTKTWQQTEVITTPSRAIFDESGTNTRTLAEGDIPSANALQLGFTLGAGYEIPLTDKIGIEPFVSYSLPITTIASDYDWRVSTLKIGASLLFDVTPGPPPPVVVERPIEGTARISGVLTSGQEVDKPTIKVEEFLSREAYPILNYIFFDESSAEIPSRYYVFEDPTGRESFNEQLLIGRKPVEVYYHTLNVIARRMNELPQATLTLTGSNMNKRIEEGAIRLSQARADRVKKYLTEIWGIAPERIKTEATDLPRSASPLDTKEGEEENRRVEITASDPRILDPLVLDQVDRTMDPPVVRVRAKATSPGARVSNVKITQGGKTLYENSAPSEMNEWTPTPSDMPGTQDPLISEVTLEEGGRTKVVTDSSRVNQLTIQRKKEERIKDKVIMRYNLITFDFDKSTLDERSQRIVQDIAKDVTNQDTIEISGFTDLTGEAQHNKKLAEERAANVEQALIARSQGKSIATTARGRGESDLVDNRLPEGRFLSRTVQVRVERPLVE